MKTTQLLVIMIAWLSAAPICLQASTVIFEDDFESYAWSGSMNPPASGLYSANWNSDGSYDPSNGAWHAVDDPVYASTFGKFANTFGLPGGEPNHRWLAFTLNAIFPPTLAELQFDYLVQTNADLEISVSTVDENTGLLSVPYTFTKRGNQGQIDDSTGVIDLMPYISPGSNLIVRFDATTTGSAYSHVRLDNFSLAIPEPATLSLLALGGLVLIRRRRRQAS